MKVAPKRVSGRVVYTLSDASCWSPRPAPGTAKVTSEPSERPIQLRCMSLTFSGQSTVSRSSARRSP